jgi:hypothetical protein
MWHTAGSCFVIEYLLDYESIFETTIVRKSRDSGVLFAQKTKDRKSGDTVTLIALLLRRLGKEEKCSRR